MQNPYAKAIDDACDAIRWRAVQYRRLVVAVCAIGLSSTIAAVASASWAPLLGWLALPVVVCLFALCDLWGVQRWRDRLLLLWRDSGLRLDAVRPTLKQLPGLPGPTLDGMLRCLPEWPDDGLPSTARIAMSDAQRAVGQLGFSIGLMQFVGISVGCLLVAVACARLQAVWLLGLLGVPVSMWGMAWLARARLVAVRRQLTRSPGLGELDPTRQSSLVRSINLHGLPRRHAAAWLSGQ